MLRCYLWIVCTKFKQCNVRD
ncbi:hypothetical protein R3I94_008128 [Phoxinus phoxinus]